MKCVIIFNYLFFQQHLSLKVHIPLNQNEQEDLEYQEMHPLPNDKYATYLNEDYEVPLTH